MGYNNCVETGYSRGASSIVITAALSIAVLIAVIGKYVGNTIAARSAHIDPLSLEYAEMPTYIAIEDADENGIPDWQDELTASGLLASSTSSASDATSTDPLFAMAENVAQALYGGYLSLKQSGSYTPERGEELGARIAAEIRAPQLFLPHTVHELTIDEDVSEKNVLHYRANLRVALAPMVTDDAPEFEYFARYLQTKDASWLERLAEAAARYRTSEAQMLAVAVPKDAVPEHLRALNSLAAYAETLEGMSRPSSDAFVAVALLKTYNENEEEMLRAFDALAQYYVRTVAHN